MAITEQQRAALAAKYPDVVAAVNRLGQIQSAPSQAPQDFMASWNAQRQANYDAAGPVLEAAASARRQATMRRNSPGVTLGDGIALEQVAPPERTEADFLRAVAAVEEAKAAGKGRHKNRSKLTADQLAANATAYREAKRAQEQAGGSFQQQARRFKRMARLGHNDPITAQAMMTPQDQFDMELIRRQFEAEQGQNRFRNEMAVDVFNADRQDAAAREALIANNMQHQQGIDTRQMTVEEARAKAQEEIARQQQNLAQQQQQFQESSFGRRMDEIETQGQWDRQQGDRVFERQGAQQQFDNQMERDRFEAQKQQNQDVMDMRRSGMSFEQALASRRAAFEERRADMANQIAMKRLEVEQGQYATENERLIKQGELNAMQAEFEREMQQQQLEEIRIQNEWERGRAGQTQSGQMTEREKALIGMIGQFDPQAAAQIASGGMGSTNIGDIFNGLTAEERQQLATEYDSVAERGWADFLNPFASERTYANRLRAHQEKLRKNLQRRGLSPEAIAREFDRIVPDDQYNFFRNQ